MINYRLSKYDPAYRDERGVYTRNEWTEFQDVGKVVDGKLATLEDWQRAEDAYVLVIAAAIDRMGESVLGVASADDEPARHVVGDARSIEDALRSMLRDGHDLCIVRAERIEIYFGWDLYVHLSLAEPWDEIHDVARSVGLFVESRRGC